MYENWKTTSLYDLTQTIAADLLKETEYPWEALPKIGDFIKELGNQLSLEKYEKKGEDIWIAKSAAVAETAAIHGPAIIGEYAQIRHCAYIDRKSVV